MTSSTGRLPQWWLDSTPHDTLEEQVERRRKEKEEKEAQQETDEKEHNGAADNDCVDAAPEHENPMESIDMNGDSTNDIKNSESSEKSRYQRSSNPRSPLGPPEEFESTDYSAERARLKPVISENGKKNRNGALSPASPISLTKTPSGRYANTETPSSNEESVRADASIVSPSEQSTESTPSSLSNSRKPVRSFKTAFTGVSPFDFAMQQRAMEQERREKERIARESLARHHAEKVESEKAREQKLKDLEQKRKKKEAEEALKKFRKETLESDLETALKRRELEDKRKKKEAELQHHEYKSKS